MCSYVYVVLCYACAVCVGETVDVSDGEPESVALADTSGRPVREKMVYMSVGDSHHHQGNHGMYFFFLLFSLYRGKSQLVQY